MRQKTNVFGIMSTFPVTTSDYWPATRLHLTRAKPSGKLLEKHYFPDYLSLLSFIVVPSVMSVAEDRNFKFPPFADICAESSDTMFSQLNRYVNTDHGVVSD